jgi:hypothetical protein
MVRRDSMDAAWQRCSSLIDIDHHRKTRHYQPPEQQTSPVAPARSMFDLTFFFRTRQLLK